MPSRVNSTVFDASAGEWQRYQSGNAGRLRNELLWEGLKGHLPTHPARVLDLGAGTGELAARCHAAGHEVTLVDFSQAMLAEASRHVSGPGVRMMCCSLDEACDRLSAEHFDVVACHSVLEFVDDQGAAIEACARRLSERGVLSVAFGNRGYAPIQTAVVQEDFERAGREISGQSEACDCFGLPKHLLDRDTMRTLIDRCGLSPFAEYGIRVVADLLDPAVASDPARFDALLALERRLMPIRDYAGVARYVQLVAARIAY